jgi:hypothetical protein
MTPIETFYAELEQIFDGGAFSHEEPCPYKEPSIRVSPAPAAPAAPAVVPPRHATMLDSLQADMQVLTTPTHLLTYDGACRNAAGKLASLCGHRVLAALVPLDYERVCAWRADFTKLRTAIVKTLMKKASHQWKDEMTRMNENTEMEALMPTLDTSSIRVVARGGGGGGGGVDVRAVRAFFKMGQEATWSSKVAVATKCGKDCLRVANKAAALMCCMAAWVLCTVANDLYIMQLDGGGDLVTRNNNHGVWIYSTSISKFQFHHHAVLAACAKWLSGVVLTLMRNNVVSVAMLDVAQALANASEVSRALSDMRMRATIARVACADLQAEAEKVMAQPLEPVPYDIDSSEEEEKCRVM